MIIDTKFNVGDKVWYLYESKVYHEKIMNINISCYEGIPYMAYEFINKDAFVGVATIKQKNVFKTKEELLKSL